MFYHNINIQMFFYFFEFFRAYLCSNCLQISCYNINMHVFEPVKSWIGSYSSSFFHAIKDTLSCDDFITMLLETLMNMNESSCVVIEKIFCLKNTYIQFFTCKSSFMFLYNILFVYMFCHNIFKRFFYLC